MLIILLSCAGIFKCLWGPGIDSKEWIPPAYVAWAGICSRVKGWKIDSWNRLGNKYGIEVPMSHVHVKINFSYRLDSWNRCLSVHKRLQIRALAGRFNSPIPLRFLAPIGFLKIPALVTPRPPPYPPPPPPPRPLYTQYKLSMLCSV